MRNYFPYKFKWTAFMFSEHLNPHFIETLTIRCLKCRLILDSLFGEKLNPLTKESSAFIIHPLVSLFKRILHFAQKPSQLTIPSGRLETMRQNEFFGAPLCDFPPGGLQQTK